MDITHFVVILAWFLGAFLGGIGGIGLLLVALPLLSLVMPVHTAVLVCCLATPFTDMTMVIRYWKYCRWKAILPMCVGIIPGSLLGLWILKIVSGPVLEGALGVFLLCFLVWQRFGHVGRGSENWKGAFTAGSLAGLLGTSIAVDGPPVGAYGLYAGWQPMAYLGTLNCFFVARSIVTVILQGTAGMYTPEVIHFTIWSVPAAIAGMLLSFPVVKHIRVDLFRTIVRVLIAAGGIVCIYHAFEKGLWERILALFAA